MPAVPPPHVMLITGTRKGIGRYLAERYARLGYVVYGCSRDGLDGEIPGYTHFKADVTDEASVRRVVRDIQERSGRLDILVNNAGIASMNPVMLTTIDAVRRIMETNFVGSFLFCREASRLMIRKRYGRIVNFSTIAVPLRLEGEAVYTASKAAVEALTRAFAREIAGFDITVNTVGPTLVRTDLVRNVPQEALERLVRRQAIQRFAEPEDIANAIDFLIRPESAMITGQTIYLGGV